MDDLQPAPAGSSPDTGDAPHRWLQRLAGEWQGTSRTWFEPGKLADESPICGTIRPILGGRFMLHEYQTHIGEDACEGTALYGFYHQRSRYETVWVDNCPNGTAMMLQAGDPVTATGDQAPPFSIRGSYFVPGHPEWGWRTTIDLPADDHLLITAYNVSPEGDEARATEICYTRRP